MQRKKYFVFNQYAEYCTSIKTKFQKVPKLKQYPHPPPDGHKKRIHCFHSCFQQLEKKKKSSLITYCKQVITRMCYFYKKHAYNRSQIEIQIFLNTLMYSHKIYISKNIYIYIYYYCSLHYRSALNFIFLLFVRSAQHCFMLLCNLNTINPLALKYICIL